MPRIDITVSGDANTSASGHVTDPQVLLQLKAILRHLSDRAQVDPVPAAKTE